MSIIKAIYDGKLFPQEQVMAGNAAYKEKLRELDGMRKDLQKKLTEEENSAVEKIVEQMYDISAMEAAETFRYGLALGLKLMGEVADFPDLDDSI